MDRTNDWMKIGLKRWCRWCWSGCACCGWRRLAL